MAVPVDEVTAGSVFVTASQELRKVVFVKPNAEGRTVVWYQRKHMSEGHRPLLFGHQQTHAPAIETFAAECDHRLTWSEICRLREQGILLAYE